MLDRALLLKPALKYAIADVDSLDQFWLLYDGRLENLKLKIFLMLFIIWLGIGIWGPSYDGKNIPHFLCKLLHLKFGGSGIGPKPK